MEKFVLNKLMCSYCIDEVYGLSDDFQQRFFSGIMLCSLHRKNIGKIKVNIWFLFSIKI